ncbi:predicted protein [Histoplasma capsulatum G186AR]|uniref:Uncharacterized protein n=1 Tax=Ajellomyces capsulatus (strain G186AR / H82 / ATCC MYA-2454 / RMSCC 2432) TaxID=447093 RepID=C0NZG6_AJECG|nr:uncharacterized protein HCBG_08546 [Histoplasma capsulatum G186AR]EEH03214.1 predicted protein [Histoplasma capsulatum G186AR]
MASPPKDRSSVQRHSTFCKLWHRGQPPLSCEPEPFKSPTMGQKFLTSMKLNEGFLSSPITQSWRHPRMELAILEFVKRGGSLDRVFETKGLSSGFCLCQICRTFRPACNRVIRRRSQCNSSVP